MSSRPLSVLIPSSWSQQKKGPASIRSNASSTQVHSPSWSTLSFDQLSLYAKKASNSSLTLLANSSEQEDKKRRRQRDKISQGEGRRPNRLPKKNLLKFFFNSYSRIFASALYVVKRLFARIL